MTKLKFGKDGKETAQSDVRAGRRPDIKKMMPLQDFLGQRYSPKPSLPDYLWEAVETGDYDAVKSALDAGAKADVCRCYTFYTVLRTAAERGHADIVRLLIDHGARIHDEGGREALIGAIRLGHTDVVKVLVERGAEIHKRIGNDTPLVEAAKAGKIDIAELLLSKGAGIEVPGVHGRTPLMGAVDANRFAMAEWLILRGAEVDARNCFGRTALMNVAYGIRDNEDMIRMLVSKGADVNAIDSYGQSAIMHSAGRTRETTELLMELGAVVDARSKEGDSALMSALEYWDNGTVAFLVSKGADVNAKNAKGKTPLMILARTGRSLQSDDGREEKLLKTAEFLISRGADVDAKNEYGRTALMVAAKFGHKSLVKLLMDAGASVKEQDNKGMNVLMIVCRSHYMKSDYKEPEKSEMLEALIEKGADINARDGSGKTALAHAIISGDIMAAQYLLEKGGVV